MLSQGQVTDVGKDLLSYTFLINVQLGGHSDSQVQFDSKNKRN